MLNKRLNMKESMDSVISIVSSPSSMKYSSLLDIYVVTKLTASSLQKNEKNHCTGFRTLSSDAMEICPKFGSVTKSSPISFFPHGISNSASISKHLFYPSYKHWENPCHDPTLSSLHFTVLYLKNVDMQKKEETEVSSIVSFFLEANTTHAF